MILINKEKLLRFNLLASMPSYKGWCWNYVEKVIFYDNREDRIMSFTYNIPGKKYNYITLTIPLYEKFTKDDLIKIFERDYNFN